MKKGYICSSCGAWDRDKDVGRKNKSTERWWRFDIFKGWEHYCVDKEEEAKVDAKSTKYQEMGRMCYFMGSPSVPWIWHKCLPADGSETI